MESLYIVIPAYNEEKNIRQVIDEWYPIVAKHEGGGDSRLVIINDGSKDNTYNMAVQCKGSRPLLEVQSKPNGGHGSALLYGYCYAIKNHAQYIFQTDSDRQTLPDEFDEFWKLKDEYDAVIGERNNRGDGRMRIFVEKVLLLILRMIFHVTMPDSNAPYRLIKAELMEKYIPLLPQNYNLPNVMLTTFFVYYKEKVKFVPITFKPRQEGENSINLKKIVKIGWKAIGDFKIIYKKMKNFS